MTFKQHLRHAVAFVLAALAVAFIGIALVGLGQAFAAEPGHTPFKPDRLDTPNSSTQKGRTVDDVPDELKLNAEQQKAVDSFAPPLSAIAVTCNGLAVSLFIQLDADHLFRADPRQSDMFTAVEQRGLPPHHKVMVQSKAPPMEWKVAYALAERAILSTHVVVPCADDKGI